MRSIPTYTYYRTYDTSDLCMPACSTKMYCSDMLDPPMVASSKASAATCTIIILLLYSIHYWIVDICHNNLMVV